MDIRLGDILHMKKTHPCGADTFEVLRTGMDFKLRCTGCSHVVEIPRHKAEKRIKKIVREQEG
ncbi:MAG: DUF951 domain-containing protein [Clostridiales bacterium]|jgi:hypothetical protein|nr:DUF951 domain-containing protein [Clostridiales bacterium]